jgi:hypothetical protein
MTERKWLTSSEPVPMLDFLGRKVGDRKPRLFACACCRDVWEWVADERSRRAVEVGETWADGTAKPAAVEAARKAAAAADRAADNRARAVPADARAERWKAWVDCAAAYAATRAVARPRGSVEEASISAIEVAQAAAGWAAALAGKRKATVNRAGKDGQGAARARQASLLRCIVGNPFRPVALDPSWRTSTVVALAEGIYADSAFDRLPVLADALQDAGCDNEQVSSHCRSGGPHARGCWVVDLLLRKK